MYSIEQGSINVRFPSFEPMANLGVPNCVEIFLSSKFDITFFEYVGDFNFFKLFVVILLTGANYSIFSL
jgi:hypothetical protein